MTDNQGADSLDLAEKLTQGLTGDTAQLAAILSPDFKMWFNFTGQTLDREQAIALIANLRAQLTGLRYRDITRSRTEHGFVQQHVSDHLLPSGERSAGVDACFVGGYAMA